MASFVSLDLAIHRTYLSLKGVVSELILLYRPVYLNTGTRFLAYKDFSLDFTMRSSIR